MQPQEFVLPEIKFPIRTSLAIPQSQTTIVNKTLLPLIFFENWHPKIESFPNLVLMVSV
jgi:hypothetical protein